MFLAIYVLFSLFQLSLTTFYHGVVSDGLCLPPL